jgi:hypothetical protein
VADDISSEDGELVEAPTALKVIAPIVAIGATLLVRKVLDKSYTAATGRTPPNAGDRDQSLRRVLVWAAATAAAVALVNVAFERLTAPKRVD